MINYINNYSYETGTGDTNLVRYVPDTFTYYWNNTWPSGTIEVTKVSYFPDIEKVIFHDPATIVVWKDGTKTVVKCNEGDTYSKETGLVMCIAKKALGNKSNFNNVIKKWLKE